MTDLTPARLMPAPAADVLERVAAAQSADPATDDLTVPLAVDLAEAEAKNAALAARVIELEAEVERLREATLREAAAIARDGCLVPPDGGSPTEAERELCEEIARRIIAHTALETRHD